MVAFLVRRTIGAILVMLAVTFIVFLIFIVVPGGGKTGTAQRIAGKNATPGLVKSVEKRWGFDQPFYVQYYRMIKRMFTNNLVSYTSQQPVLSQIVQGMPATFSLTIGAGLIWLSFGILVGVISAITAGRLSDRLITILARHGDEARLVEDGGRAYPRIGPRGADRRRAGAGVAFPVPEAVAGARR